MTEQSYKKLTHEQHVLELPDTYIGDIEQNTIHTWYYNETDRRMRETDLTYIPGEYKLYDEIIVNSLDQYTRMKEGNTEHPVRNIKINVDKTTGEICVYNDGEGIPVRIHPEEKKYIPEMIFGTFLHRRTITRRNLNMWGAKMGMVLNLQIFFQLNFL